MQKFPMTDPVTPPLRDRAYLHTVQAGAVLPLLQAGVSALAAGLITLLIFSLTRARGMFAGAGIAMVIVFIGDWIFLQRHWIHLTADKVMKLDPGWDEKMDEPDILRIEVTDPKPESWERKIYDFPATANEMEILAEGVQAGTGFKEAYWTGAGAPFSQVKFRRLIAFLLSKKLIEFAGRSANQGYKLTDLGRSIFEKLAPPPSPLAERKP